MIFYNIVLSITVAWPLLLAIPALHSRLPWPRHLAVMPAAALVVLLMLSPADASLELPWLFFGSGFAVEDEIRWVLAMCVVIWFAAASITETSASNPAHHRATPFFALALAGNLGAILAIDLVGFFSFSTLMGYSFYALLIQQGNNNKNNEALRAGRLYITFLIVADLALFETLLLTASTTENLRFDAVHLAMAEAPASQFILWMAFAGFVIKAGVWPAHLWLSAAFKSACQSTTMLLGGVPVAMGLLGTLRWLPLGEHRFFISGTVIQTIGVAATLYVALRFFTSERDVKMLPAWFTVAATGLFIAALGTGLAYPTIWQQYTYLMYAFIASLGIVSAALAFATSKMQDTRPSPDQALQRVDRLNLWAGQWFGEVQRWTMDRSLRLQSLWRISWIKALKQLQRTLDWQKPGVCVGEWRAAITLFVLLGLVLAWLLI